MLRKLLRPDRDHIAEIDKTLDLLRVTWLEAKFEDKAKWMARIHSVLDARLLFMAIRDELSPPPPAPTV